MDHLDLENEGIDCVIGFSILTTDIVEKFCSEINTDIIVTRHYVGKIFEQLLWPLILTLSSLPLPFINRLALLKMLVKFTQFTVTANCHLQFPAEQLKTTLQIIEKML